jgi:hypothetical protein
MAEMWEEEPLVVPAVHAVTVVALAVVAFATHVPGVAALAAHAVTVAALVVAVVVVRGVLFLLVHTVAAASDGVQLVLAHMVLPAVDPEWDDLLLLAQPDQTLLSVLLPNRRGALLP